MPDPVAPIFEPETPARPAKQRGGNRGHKRKHSKRQPPAALGVRTFLVRHGANASPDGGCVTAPSSIGAWTGRDRGEALQCRDGSTRRNVCVLLAAAGLVGVPPARLCDKLRGAAREAFVAPGPLDEAAEITWADLRETIHDLDRPDHDLSGGPDHDLNGDALAFFEAPSLAGRLIPMVEVTAGVITKVTLITHPGRTRPGSRTGASVLFFHHGEGDFGALFNSHPYVFSYEGATFASAEKALTFAKARLFDDAVAQAAILDEPRPLRAKRLGRKVRGLNAELWGDAALAIAESILTANFAQNADLRSVLLSTGDARLGEASPSNPLWGIGMSANDPCAQNP